ncbi:MAG: glutathionylspermidine synthase family protein [Acidobacteriota bacterium]|nr:glutathionylspermidine synthase family protein [Acidobacteriota bacterium]
MERHRITPRTDWKQKVEKLGLVYHTLDDGSGNYWDESVYYEFTAAEVDRLEAASARLQEMCLAAGQSIIDHNRWSDLKIPAEAIPQIKKTWNDEPPALYGRFDLAYDGCQIKLLEYNADTPTALLEAAVVQWYWLEEVFPGADQWNSIHEKLVDKWKDLKDYVTEPVSFAYSPSLEDEFTVGYLRDTAEQAGLKTQALAMKDIGFDHNTFTFVDLNSQPIKSIFKLYPWEWLLKEEFGPRALDFMDKTQWIEPVWKMMFSNKGLLAILWEMYPGDELLLPAYFDGPRDLTDYARKPLLGREGANVQVIRRGEKEQNYGPYGAEGFVYQALAPIPALDGAYPVLGSWMIADQGPAGMGIRESDSIITNNRSRFVPHLFR